eukprot:7913839-Alexandrium_andersonii.AAC.1
MPVPTPEAPAAKVERASAPPMPAAEHAPAMALLAKLLKAGAFGEGDPAVVAARALAPDRAKQEPSGDEELHA